MVEKISRLKRVEGGMTPSVHSDMVAGKTPACKSTNFFLSARQTGFCKPVLGDLTKNPGGCIYNF